MDAEQELKRRRERGRQAQAAFRKRQAKAALSVQEENKQLREAIESIVQAANRGDNTTDLLSVIRQAAAAAGIEAKHLEVSATNDVALPTNAKTGCPNYGSSSNTYDTTIGSALINGGSSKSRTIVPPITWSRNQPPPVVMGNFWFDPLRSTNITTAPEDAVPYIGQGRYTLGGLLFWGVLDHVTNVCTHMHHPRSCEETQSMLRRSTAHSKSLSRVRPEFLYTMAEARLEYLQNGQVDAILATDTDRSSLKALRSMVEKDYASQGTDTSAWMLPREVEGRVRRRLGGKIFSRLEQAVKAPENTPAHRALKETIDRMVDAFMCFGNGPAWNNDFVDMVFGEWAALESQ